MRRAMEVWHTAVEYQLWHALALALAVHAGRGRAGRVAVVALALGIVLFSGSLYALALGAPRWCGVITPLGGLGFVVGWVALAWSLRRAAEAALSPGPAAARHRPVMRSRHAARMDTSLPATRRALAASLPGYAGSCCSADRW